MPPGLNPRPPRKCTHCQLGWVFETCLPPLPAGAVTCPVWPLSWQSSVNQARLMFALKGWARGLAHSLLSTLPSSGDGVSARELGVRFLGYSQHWLAIQKENLGHWETGQAGQNFPVRGG